MKKLMFILLFAVLGSNTLALNRNIQDPFNVEGDLELLRCAEKGNFELKLFWDAMVYSDSLEDGVVEPIADITSRNQCHAGDIMILLRHQDKIRSEIRDSVFKCRNEELARLKKAYNKIRAEIFYVRNVVDGTLSLSLPYDMLGTEAIGDFTVTDRDVLYTEMVEKYVNDNFFTLDELNVFFNELENKYRSRLPAYMQCERGSWKVVADKWVEFQKHFTEDYGGLKEAGANISASADSLGSTILNTNTVKLLSQEDGLADFVGSFYQINVNGLEARAGGSEILDDLRSNFSSSDVGSFSSVKQSDFIGAYSASGEAFSRELEIAKLSSEFRQLYRGSGDTVEVFLNSLDGRDSKEETGFLEILEDSYPLLEELNDHSKTINRRQCKV